jgi:hypothetical protein
MVFKVFDTVLIGAVIRIHTGYKNWTYTTSVNDRVLQQLNYIKWFGPTYQHISADDNFLANIFSRLHRLDDETTLLLNKRESTVENFSFILDDFSFILDDK